MKVFLILSLITIDIYGVVCLAPAVTRAQDRAITVYPQQRFSVDGLAVGQPVAPNSKAYHQYECQPSEQYEQFTNCYKSHSENGIQISRRILYALI